MCGRFVLTPTDEFYERFNIVEQHDALTPRYNIAPGQDVAVVVRHSPNRLVLMRWGLIPRWAKDEKIGYKTINARAETLTERPAYRNLIRSKRCLVPASGFYEWQDTGKKGGKQPYYIHAADNAYLAFAGLYDFWKDATGQTIDSCTIITTAATGPVQSIHTRMPVILTPTAEALWLDPKITDAKTLLPLLQAVETIPLALYKVSKAVNSARHDAPELITQTSEL
jgi:putative SOS response-associated peptidase YedK